MTRPEVDAWPGAQILIRALVPRAARCGRCHLSVTLIREALHLVFQGAPQIV